MIKGVDAMAGRLAILAVAGLLCTTVTSPAVAAQDPPVTTVKSGPLSPTLKEMAGDLPTSGTALPAQMTAKGRVLVDVRVQDTSAATVQQLREAGAAIRFVSPEQRTVTVAVDPGDLDALAELTSVEYAEQVPRPLTNADCPSGTFVSEGLNVLKANLARSLYSVTGRDVTVGVLSDSYDGLKGAAGDVSKGELPGTGNPCGHTLAVDNLKEGVASKSDEGRAMAQIIHDLAPDAKILFAAGLDGQAAFAQNIRDLAAAGADIIVDDLTYPSEPMYQDGIVAKAVADVGADGVLYFSSAANSNAIVNGQNVGSYESLWFRPNDCPAEIVKKYKGVSVDCHDFDPSAKTDTTYGLSVNYISYLLSWNQPHYGVTTDFDVCVENDFDTVIFCMQTDNLLSQAPYEGFQYWFAGDPFPANLVIVRTAGTGMPRLRLVSVRSELTSVEYPTSSGLDTVGPTTFGHNASIPAVTVAAAPFSSPTTLEDYSSWGPATYCWEPVVGTQAAKQLASCQNATVDVTAPDGTQNSFFGGTDMFGVHRFYGTSAAAPHAAAVAALLLDREQCLTPAQLLAYLQTGARKVGAGLPDGSGAGLIDATAALAAAGAAKCDKVAPQVVITAPHGTPSGWLTQSPVTVKVTATDRRTVTAINCTQANVTGFTAAGKTSTANAAITGQGQRVVTCTAQDAEGNSGASLGSSNTLTVKIDSIAPQLACRPASFEQGKPGTVVADVSDNGSGQASATVSTSVSTASPGTFTATLAGKDVAGNSGSAGCGYTVVAAPDTTGPTVTCRPTTVTVGQVATVTADVTDTGSGPLSPTVSATIPTTAPGQFTLSLTGSDTVGNTTTVACPYTVTALPVGPVEPQPSPTATPAPGPKASLTGRVKVRRHVRVTYSAVGLPPSATASWTLVRKGTTVKQLARATDATGAGRVTVRFAKRGRYIVRVVSGTAEATLRVRVR